MSAAAYSEMVAGRAPADRRAAQAKRRRQGTYEAYLRGETRVPPLFYPDDHARPFDPDDRRHGTLSGYTQGCRCTWCSLAGKAWRKHRKAGLTLPRGWNSRDHLDDTA